MSTDPYGILFYGFALPEINFDYHDTNEAWESGHAPSQPSDTSNYRTPEWDEWRTRHREWQKSIENIEIDWSGGENCEQYFLHCAGLKKSVEWNELLVLSPSDLDAPPEAARLLHEYCDRFGLPKGEPKWHLASRYF